MKSISRRTFLRQSGGGAAALGALAAFPGLPALRRKLRPAAVHAEGLARPEGSAHDSPLIVHVPEPATGQVHLLFGTREVVRHDRALVARLVDLSR